ncbi:ATP-binding cassette domain-containing protein, partial [Rhizobium sp. CRIBSB]|nr:ATP-binding cassette domain-containing protein [Rhizobium sp. CRIBSB]
MPVSPARASAAPSLLPAAVRLQAVGFGYAETPGVLSNIDLTLPSGSFHFLTGPSGAGKSSLLKLLTLVERPVSGRVELFGEDVTAVTAARTPLIRRRIGT